MIEDERGADASRTKIGTGRINRRSFNSVLLGCKINAGVSDIDVLYIEGIALCIDGVATGCTVHSAVRSIIKTDS